MNAKWTVSILLSLYAMMVLFSSVTAMQDDGLLINLPNAQQAWALEVDSAHPDAPQFGLSVSAHPNSFCADGNLYKDVVYQLGMNISADNQRLLDAAQGGMSINWESDWCSSNTKRMTEWQVRYLTPAGTSGRLYHTEVCYDGSCVSNRIFGKWVSIGEWNKNPVVTFQSGRAIYTGSFGAWGSYGPSSKPTLDLSSPTLACDVAQVLASYGMAQVTGEC